MKTIDSLGIFWLFNSDDQKYIDEIDGLIFYGYWGDFFTVDTIIQRISDFEKLWGDHGASIEIKYRNLSEKLCAELMLEVRIVLWPEEAKWFECLKKSFDWFLNLGAKLTWCGTELSDASILGLDVDSDMGGNVYAACSEKVGFICKSNLLDPYLELDGDELNYFRDELDYLKSTSR